jgi:hypothetical protein
MNNPKTLEINTASKYGGNQYHFGVIIEGEKKGTAFKKHMDSSIEEIPFESLPIDLIEIYKNYK